jgi:hypothetical protein
MAKAKTFQQSMDEQLHAGIRTDGKSWWHTNDAGNYWSGWMPSNLAPEQLFVACTTTIADLMRNHPELAEKLGTLFTQRNDG